MSDRGDVLRLRRRVGFGPVEEAESVVVVQASRLNAALPTLIVVPLHPETDALARDPTAVRVSAAECGRDADQVALVTQVRAVRREAIAETRSGRLLGATQASLDRILRLVLALP